MPSTCVMGLDIGTTNCKAILVDEKGAIIGAESTEYPLAMPQSGWAEQDPGLWWDGIATIVRKMLAKTGSHFIRMIGITGQMHGLVTLDKKQEVLRPAILWNDQRSAAYSSTIYSRAGGEGVVVSRTGNLMLPGFLAGKLLWLKENEPRTFEKIDKILLPKDYVRYRLCGDVATDFSDASGTGLFDPVKRSWAEDLLQKIGLPENILPQYRLASETAGTLSKKAAEQLGLPVGIPIITGGGDAIMQSVGSASTDGNSVLVVIGTGGNVTMTVDRVPKTRVNEVQLFCHVLAEKWALVGVSLTAGSSLRWFRDTFVRTGRTADQDSLSAYDLLGMEASHSSPGSNGLMFIPYLQGERCPYIDPIVRGSWLGLSLGTTRKDAIRSVMEGVGYSLFSILELVSRGEARPTVIHAAGGGSASPLWRQILADITKTEVRTMDHSEDASSLGAAFVAGVQAGLWTSVEEATSLVKVKTVDRPNLENSERYAELFRIYNKQYAGLRETYRDLHRVFEK